MDAARSSSPFPRRGRIAASALFGAALTLAAGDAAATVLYKSVSTSGVVQFSDTPPENARVVEVRPIADPPRAGSAFASGGSGLLDAFENPLQTVADGSENDAALARANAQVDLAEHALALARRDLWRQLEGLRLEAGERSRTDEERLEFYRKNLAAARSNLVAALRQRTQ
ncbi:MAG TPA: DUF4124 domain-containing protein [Usitatibacter sp.]|nr:DUF4124 domain-containing protein [Usitatibacter sp.]